MVRAIWMDYRPKRPLRNESNNCLEDDACMIITRWIEVPDGSHVVGLTAVDASGNRREATHTPDVIVDKDSPTFASLPLLQWAAGGDGQPLLS